MGLYKLSQEIRSCSLSAPHKSVMWVLESYISKVGGCAYPSLDTLAKQAGVSRSTVKRVLKDLNAWKIVRWQQELKGDQMVNHYFFNKELCALGGRFTMDLLVGSNEGEGRSTMSQG